MPLPSISCGLFDLQKSPQPISTGIGFLNHMLDQLNSHAQVGVQLQVSGGGGGDINWSATLNQSELLNEVGKAVGLELHRITESVDTFRVSTFFCPLDEALSKCEIGKVTAPEKVGSLKSFTLAPYGKFPSTGRTRLGHLETRAIESFWQGLAETSRLSIRLDKIRGNNAHHIVESSFKAFSRALRNYIDGVDTTVHSSPLDELYGHDSGNFKASVGLVRRGTVSRKTKETFISVDLELDGGSKGVVVATGVKTLDTFFQELAKAARVSLQLTCSGDLYIDEHHTAEDVSIALGQAMAQALGTKAGLNRMWCAIDSHVAVTMDLSNRPCCTHNLSLDSELIGDLSSEMFEHVLESLVMNARMTVHIVESCPPTDLMETVVATAKAFGQAFLYCSMVDGRRAGATASSKGTLSL